MMCGNIYSFFKSTFLMKSIRCENLKSYNILDVPFSFETKKLLFGTRRFLVFMRTVKCFVFVLIIGPSASMLCIFSHKTNLRVLDCRSKT
jgi:hypothetical protein